jgi:hypothetical protein
MGELGDALLSSGRQLEVRLRTHWEPLMKDGLDRALPQSWRFETESEIATLVLDPHGKVSVRSDVVEPPDVIVRWQHARLLQALLSGRGNEMPRDAPPRIVFANDRGRKAFSLLGTSLGI